jgi:hypothetical protein
MDSKKALELRVENLTAELQKAKGQAGDAEASTQQLQVCYFHTSLHATACRIQSAFSFARLNYCALPSWLLLVQRPVAFTQPSHSCGCLHMMPCRTPLLT